MIAFLAPIARAALVFTTAATPVVALIIWWASWAAGHFSTPWMLVQMVVVLCLAAGWVLLVVDVSFWWLARGRSGRQVER